MTEISAKYHIFSKLNEEPNAGIWYMYQEQSQQPEKRLRGQPVRIKADLVEWVATPPIGGGGQHRLGPGPYKYSTELEGEVFATNDFEDRKWFIRPGNEKDTYLISVDEESKYVWTAVEPEKPVRIEPFRAGDWSQVFKIVPNCEDDA